MSPSSCQTAPPRDLINKYSARKVSGSMRSSQRLGLRSPWTPHKQPGLDLRDDEIEDQRKQRQHEDARKNRVDVEYTLRLVDQVADALRRAKVFANYRADERQA